MALGGKRAGAGRPCKDPSGKGKPTTVWLSPAQREALTELTAALGVSASDVMSLGLVAGRKRLEKLRKIA